MERDFLGLHTVNNGSSASAASAELVTNRNSGMQWSFSNNGSTQSPYMSFRASQEEKLPSGFMTVSTLDSLDVNQKSQYQSAAYPLHQFSAHSITRSQETKMFPSMSQPSQIFTAQNQVGSTDLRTANKPIGNPAQMTIFYAGAVCVYNDVSPEKAKTIMLLAGNETQVTNTSLVDESSESRSFPQQLMGLQGNSRGTMHGFDSHALQSAVSLESPVRQQQEECPKLMSSAGTSSTSMFPSPPVALPQFRKASLARFLEKRKERVLSSSSPYSLSSLSPDSNLKRTQKLNLCLNTLTL